MSRTHPGRFHIAIPGPTNIPERILNAMHISSEDQRNPEIPNLTIPLYKDVKKFSNPRKVQFFYSPDQEREHGNPQSLIPCHQMKKF